MKNEKAKQNYIEKEDNYKLQMINLTYKIDIALNIAITFLVITM